MERWHTNGVGPLAATDGLRQALLRSYFEPAGFSLAHASLARLCAAGRIRMVLTTNFDRLIEHALDAAGVHSQVIASPEAATEMTPGVHAGVTIVGLRGDYAMPGQRNTPEELGAYPAQWRLLLHIVICGTVLPRGNGLRVA